MWKISFSLECPGYYIRLALILCLLYYGEHHYIWYTMMGFLVLAVVSAIVYNKHDVDDN